MLDLHRRVMRQSVEVVDLIKEDQWDLPTPCARWNVRQLVVHMTLDNRGFAAAAGDEAYDRSVWSDDTDFDDDLRVAYAKSADLVVAAFGVADIYARKFWLPRVTQRISFPARMAISFHLLDYLVHRWDVGVSLGHRVTFDDDLVEVVAEIAAREVPDGPRRHHPEAGFAPPVPVPSGTSASDRLLAALGRSPSWPG